MTNETKIMPNFLDTGDAENQGGYYKQINTWKAIPKKQYLKFCLVSKTGNCLKILLSRGFYSSKKVIQFWGNQN